MVTATNCLAVGEYGDFSIPFGNPDMANQARNQILAKLA
jgi:hypothetical protein